MAKWECPDCHTLNANPSKSCEICGTPRLKARALASSRICWADGGRRREDGFCEVGQGYPVGMVCPFACPVCRQRLAWDGGCPACHGSATGDREGWTFPGDRYETERSHWVFEAKGPRPAVAPGRVHEFVASLAHKMSWPPTDTSTAPVPALCVQCHTPLLPHHRGDRCTNCWFATRTR